MEAPGKKFCLVCNDQEDDEVHQHNPQHKVNQLLQNFYQNRTSHRSPKNGVQLSIEVKSVNGFTYNFTSEADKQGTHYLNITPEEFSAQNNKVEFICRITNERRRINDSIVIVYAGVLHSFKPYSMIYPEGQEKEFVQVESGDSYTVTVRLQLEESHVSNFKIPVCYYIQTAGEAGTTEAFIVLRSIVVAIQEEVEDVVQLTEKSPFTNNRWDKVKMTPARHKNKFIKTPEFSIPKRYFKTLLFGLTKNFEDGVLEEIRKTLKPGHVTKENYREFFHTLLWMEETCSILGLSCYNMEDVHLKYREGDMLELKVPGLAEKRPSVLRGDYIELRIHADHTSYQGIIRDVTDKTVLIEGLDQVIVDSVYNNPDLSMDVRFVLSRIHYERMHQGIEQVVSTGFVDNLFPSEKLLLNPVVEMVPLTRDNLRNRSIFDNNEQFTAVRKIINNTSNGAPYIVWGPPGTGKTVTIVEAIYQLKRLTNVNILVCAPANAACNMLTEKLAEFCSPTELRRIMSENADYQSVHEKIINYCNLKVVDGHIEFIPFIRTHLKKFRIIVTTLVLAGKYTREYHPDIIFVDEAAQAREPEACCAIGLLVKTKRLILTGDPMQLGPVINSEICKKYKYDISLLERLMQSELYKNDTENNFTTMLKQNFRSHPEILKLPNQMFYKNQLSPVSESAINDPLAKTNIYKLIQSGGYSNQNGSPIEFCSVLATEQRQGRSPSYFNSKEVLMVKKYVEVLTRLKFPQTNQNISPMEIGVVTPYIRQMYKIREALQEYRDIEVGTTEAFQGREKRVMIISTVRAQEDLLLYDQKYKVGFVKEPKRFNVAITRAKSKLIVIGNPLVLTKDEKWYKLILQCKELRTLCGAPFPLREEVEQVTDRLIAFNIDDKPDSKKKKIRPPRSIRNNIAQP